MPLRSKQKIVLIKSEGASYGVDPTPTGSDALLINDDLELMPLAGDTVARNVIRPFRGAFEQMMSNTQVGITLSVELANSGTAGTAPKYADLLRACSMAQTITGSALTGTATAGSAGSITLAVGTSAVDGFYNGQIISITGGTGNGHVGLIVGYVGSTRTATVNPISATFVPGASSTYSIAINVAFKPISTVQGVSDTSVAIRFNVDGVQHALLGCRGTWTVTCELGQIPRLQFTMTGIYVAPADVAQSTYTISYTNQATPLVFRRGNVQGFRFYNVAFCLQSLSFDYGNDVQYRELVNCVEYVDIPDGQSTGTMMVEATLLATFNAFSNALTDGTLGAMGFVHGTAAGARAALVAPRCDVGKPTYSSDRGSEMLTLPFTAIPGTGNDDAYLVFS
jgi:hypothetical protein